MGFPLLVRWHLYIESEPCLQFIIPLVMLIYKHLTMPDAWHPGHSINHHTFFYGSHSNQNTTWYEYNEYYWSHTRHFLQVNTWQYHDDMSCKNISLWQNISKLMLFFLNAVAPVLFYINIVHIFQLCRCPYQRHKTSCPMKVYHIPHYFPLLIHMVVLS